MYFKQEVQKVFPFFSRKRLQYKRKKDLMRCYMLIIIPYKENYVKNEYGHF